MFDLFKKREIIIRNKQELIDTLTTISALLNESDHVAQAAAVDKPLRYLKQDQIPDFLKALKTVDIWGGSGSAWEVGVFSSDQSQKEFQKMFIRLAEQLKNTGIKIKSADQIANLFKQELRRNK